MPHINSSFSVISVGQRNPVGGSLSQSLSDRFKPGNYYCDLSSISDSNVLKLNWINLRCLLSVAELECRVNNNNNIVLFFCSEIKFVQLSDGNERVRRVIERSTLMLREIPASVSEKVRLVFVGQSSFSELDRLLFSSVELLCSCLATGG